MSDRRTMDNVRIMSVLFDENRAECGVMEVTLIIPAIHDDWKWLAETVMESDDDWQIEVRSKQQPRQDNMGNLTIEWMGASYRLQRIESEAKAEVRRG